MCVHELTACSYLNSACTLKRPWNELYCLTSINNQCQSILLYRELISVLQYGRYCRQLISFGWVMRILQMFEIQKKLRHGMHVTRYFFSEHKVSCISWCSFFFISKICNTYITHSMLIYCLLAFHEVTIIFSLEEPVNLGWSSSYCP